MKIWSCKIGECEEKDLLDPQGRYYGADWPMRRAVQEAYFQVTGKQSNFTFSGWAAELTEGERACVENRPPAPSGEKVNEIATCELCGEPMPGEEMFNYHGYSGPCPKPPLPRVSTEAEPRGSAKDVVGATAAKASTPLPACPLPEEQVREIIDAQFSSYHWAWNRSLNTLTTALSSLPRAAGTTGGEWWKEAAIDVMRQARTDSLHDSLEDWRNAIINGLLRAYNYGQDAALANRDKLVAQARLEEAKLLYDEVHRQFGVNAGAIISKRVAELERLAKGEGRGR